MRAHLFLAIAAVIFRPVFAAESAASARPSTAAVKEKLRAVVRGQLDAFARQDFPAAYAFAAPEIQEQFSLADFEKMVKSTYPIIANSTEAVFGLILDDGSNALVNVRIVGRNQGSVNYQYLLEKVGEQWRIGGVTAARQNHEPPL